MAAPFVVLGSAEGLRSSFPWACRHLRGFLSTQMALLVDEKRLFLLLSTKQMSFVDILQVIIEQIENNMDDSNNNNSIRLNIFAGDLIV